MINLAICDDDLPFTTEIESLIIKHFTSINIGFHIDIFFDGDTLWQKFQQANSYDIVFLDIKMKTDGITAARKIRANNFDTLIIYISSYTTYLQELFEVEPFRFIQKPIKKDVFHSYLSMAIKKVLSGKHIYPFYFRKTLHTIYLKNIVYFESQLHTIVIHTNDGTFHHYGKLNNVENMLTNAYPPFLRIHQSFLVNLQYVRSINHSTVILHDDTVLKISEHRRKEILLRYGQIMEYL